MGRGTLDGAEIPIGGSLWRALGRNGALTTGYVLLGLHVLVVVVCQLVAASVAPWKLGSFDIVVASAPLYSTVFVPLIGSSILFIGELQRRGSIRRNRDAPADTALPQASNTSLWRMISPTWSLFWAVLGGSVCMWLVALMGNEQLATTNGDLTWVTWLINGLMIAGLSGAALGSMVKKRAWTRRQVRTPRPEVKEVDDLDALHPLLRARVEQARGKRRTGGGGTAFWRWFSFRWRFDAWMCAFGAIGIFFGAAMLQIRGLFPDDRETATLLGTWGIAGGAVLLVAGLYLTTQFWRAGEDLAAAESVA